MTTVIDLGPVDWGRIWGDRAGLVTEAHLKELNAISNAVHSQHPGYWRNLFSSYPEVVSSAGQIARLYVRPGQTPSAFATSQPARMPEPASMNKQVEDKRNQTIREVEERNAQPPPHPITQGFLIIGREIKEQVPGVKKAIEITDKIGETVSNVADTVSNVATAARNITANASNLTSNVEGVLNNAMLVGGVIAAAYVYSLVK
jgi:hypothetical protein